MTRTAGRPHDGNMDGDYADDADLVDVVTYTPMTPSQQLEGLGYYELTGKIGFGGIVLAGTWWDFGDGDAPKAPTENGRVGPSTPPMPSVPTASRCNTRTPNSPRRFPPKCRATSTAGT